MKSVWFWTAPALVLLSTTASADGGAAHRSKQTPPVKMGTSGGSANDASSAFCCGGTLGALVLRNGVLSILSNNHVLGRSGAATAGEDTVQPGLIDSGCSSSNSNIVGDYAGNLVPLGSANVDAAISTARSNVDTSGAILDIGVPRSAVQNATVGLPVMKSGRTTGFTTGSITATNVSVNIQYQQGCGKGKKFTISFTNQLATGAMSAGGDSGSMLYSNDGSPNPVGLLYAGSSSTTIYNPAQHVVNAFSAGGNSFSFVGTAGLTADNLPAKLGIAPDPSDMEVALAVKVENEVEILRRPGVLGIGVGATEHDPRQPAIVIFFDRSNVLQMPDTLDGIPVRYVLTDPIVAQ